METLSCDKNKRKYFEISKLYNRTNFTKRKHEIGNRVSEKYPIFFISDQ